MYNNEFSQEFEQAFGQELEAGGTSMESFEFNPEFMGETAGETQGESFEMSGEFEQEFSNEYSGEFGHETSGELHETQEMELAHELLEVSNEQELNMFLGKLIKSAGRAIGNFAKSSAGRAIGGALKSVAKKVIPIAGGALGTFVGGPLGGMVGSKLGSMASNLFELELEGLSPEDQEFELSRAFVRLAHGAAQRGAALQRQRPGAPAAAIARQALGAAARQHAPGLLRPRNPDGTFRSMNGRSGQRPGRRPGTGAGARRPAQGGGARRPSGGGSGRPSYPSQQGRPAYGGPVYGGPAYVSNGYAPTDNGYDQPTFDDNGDQGYGYGSSSSSGNGSTRGTWMRRGRTLVIQL